MDRPPYPQTLPSLLYTAGVVNEYDAVRLPITGFDLDSLSMCAVLIG